MKKALVVSLVLVAALFTFGTVNKVYASSTNPAASTVAGNYGPGGQVGMMDGTQQKGLLHDEMVTVIAEKLGISVEDLNTRLINGETLYTVAIAEGLTNDEAKALLLEARGEAIDLAVTNGDLTQTQADWMKSRIKLMEENGFTGARGMMGGNHGANGSGTGTCTGVYTTK
jgi:hypothetical protein